MFFRPRPAAPQIALWEGKFTGGSQLLGVDLGAAAAPSHSQVALGAKRVALDPGDPDRVPWFAQLSSSSNWGHQ